MKKYLYALLLIALALISGCASAPSIESWEVMAYEALDDIISIEEMEDQVESAATYKVRYKSDEYEVIAFLSVPIAHMEAKETMPCIIYNRGGNGNQGFNTPRMVAGMAEFYDVVTFASQYRGVSGGTGKDECGGAELQDVIGLINLCEKFAFVDSDAVYMLGVSRGGMTTYQTIRADKRVKKAAVVSGIADVFINYEIRLSMNEFWQDITGGTPEEVPEEYEKRSATCWADELNCPVLIIHSKGDDRCLYAEAEKMVQCLEDAGKEYKFVSYDDAVHGIRAEDVAIIAEWFGLDVPN